MFHRKKYIKLFFHRALFFIGRTKFSNGVIILLIQKYEYMVSR